MTTQLFNPPCQDCGEPTSHASSTRCKTCAQAILDTLWPPDTPAHQSPAPQAAPPPEAELPNPANESDLPDDSSAAEYDQEFPPPPDLF